jgi:hypothetical protein
MPSDNDPNSLAEPEPVTTAEKARFTARVAAVVTLIVGGSVALASMLTPTTCRGATRSAKLKWQERQAQIEEAVASQSPTENPPSENSSSPGVVEQM